MELTWLEGLICPTVATHVAVVREKKERFEVQAEKKRRRNSIIGL